MNVIKLFVRYICFLLLFILFSGRVLAFSSSLFNDTSDWSFETSGAVEKISKVDMGYIFEAGGDVASSHYSRVKYKLPERFGNVLTGFYFKVGIELPVDFYQKQKASFRIINTDNYTTTLNGKSVGSSNENELRTAVYIGTNQKLQVIANYETVERNVLWESDEPLSVGKHIIEFYGNVALDLPWELKVDGIKLVGGVGKLSPNSVPVDERVITRFVAGIDGAASQDNNSMSLLITDLIVADGFEVINDKVTLVDFGMWKIEYLAGRSTLVDFGVWKDSYLTN